MTAFGGERRITARVGPGGEVVEQKQPLSFHRILAMIAFGAWALCWLLVVIQGMASYS